MPIILNHGDVIYGQAAPNLKVSRETLLQKTVDPLIISSLTLSMLAILYVER